MQLWTSSVQCIIVGGDSPVFLAASSEGSQVVHESSSTKAQVSCAGDQGELPAVFFENGRRVFALTAFDPPGEKRDLKANTEANSQLYGAIKAMGSTEEGAASVKPSAVWPSFGFHLGEGWREDGFCLVFDGIVDVDRDEGCKREVAKGPRLEEVTAAVVALASRFNQGAIFAYSPLRKELHRVTVPCHPSAGMMHDNALPMFATIH
jgi:hypothetical protein